MNSASYIITYKCLQNMYSVMIFAHPGYQDKREKHLNYYFTFFTTAYALLVYKFCSENPISSIICSIMVKCSPQYVRYFYFFWYFLY